MDFQSKSQLRVIMSIDDAWLTAFDNVVRADVAHSKKLLFAFACQFNIESCVKSLLQARSNGKSLNIDGHVYVPTLDTPSAYAVEANPLILACKYGHEKIVRILLKAGADATIRTKGDFPTALHHAARKGSKNICRLLLMCRANPNALNWRRRTPLYYACLHDQASIVFLLVKAAARIQSISEQNTILAYVFRVTFDSSEFKPLMSLLDNLPDVGYQHPEGKTPLTLAIETANEEPVKAMLQRGASLRGGLGTYDSPLYTASHTGSLIWLVRMMMDNDWGASYDWDTQDGGGRTVLHWAAEFGYVELMRDLVDAAVSLNIKDNYDETPLHYAAESGHLKGVELLLDRGADPGSMVRVMIRQETVRSEEEKRKWWSIEREGWEDRA